MKHKIVKRPVKHVFTAAEIAEMNRQFRAHDRSASNLEAEQKAVVKSYQSKVASEEMAKNRIGDDLDAGFEMREKSLVVILHPADKPVEKRFYLESDLLYDGVIQMPDERCEPVLIEQVTDADRQQLLIETEAQFECREVIQLFSPAGNDFGRLTVGRLPSQCEDAPGLFWFSALTVQIGKHTLAEHLNPEQKCSKARPDQIARACDDFLKWCKSVGLDSDVIKGFKNAVALVKAEHAEREE